MPRQTVAAVIPNKNSATTVRQTLESLRFCDEVIVVDMFSTDDSKKICLEYPNVRFFEREGYIYGNFNFGVDQSTSDWIIRIDSDEVISPELRESIIEVLEGRVSPQLDVYEAFCHLYFFGKRLHHGFGNHWRTTLFRRGVTRYKVQSEHEGLEYKGRVGRLKGHYDHFTNASISRWLEKLNYYSDRDVERVDKPRPESVPRVTYHTLRTFQRLYLRPGWLLLDGHLGFVVAGISAFSIFLQHAKTWERAESDDA